MRAIAVLVLLALAPLAASVGPGQDDAGSGQDAGDLPQFPHPVGEGTWSGTLVPPVDTFDAYGFTPPPASRIFYDVVWNASGGASTLLAPDGESRLSGDVADAPGTWVLRFGALRPLSYTVTLRFERYESAIQIPSIAAEGVALSIVTTNGTRVHYDFSDRAVEKVPTHGSDANVFYVRASRPWTEASWYAAYLRSPGRAEPRVVAESEGLRVDLNPVRELPIAEPAIRAGFRGGFADAATIDAGTAWARGTVLRGWVLYDGPPPEVTVRPFSAAFLTSKDLRGSVVGLGPVTSAEAEATWTLTGGSQFVVVDTRNATAGPTEATVHPPSGPEVHLAGNHSVWWPRLAQPGTWSADFRLGTVEMEERFLVVYADFPFGS